MQKITLGKIKGQSSFLEKGVASVDTGFPLVFTFLSIKPNFQINK